jgi:hypothetical protein
MTISGVRGASVPLRAEVLHVLVEFLQLRGEVLGVLLRKPIPPKGGTPNAQSASSVGYPLQVVRDDPKRRRGRRTPGHRKSVAGFMLGLLLPCG